MSTLRNPFAPFDPALTLAFEENIRWALAEDIGAGDWTAMLVPEALQVNATVTVREQAVLCGAPWFEAVMLQIDPRIDVVWEFAEGALMPANSTVCRIGGPARSLLTWNGSDAADRSRLGGTAEPLRPQPTTASAVWLPSTR